MSHWLHWLRWLRSRADQTVLYEKASAYSTIVVTKKEKVVHRGRSNTEPIYSFVYQRSRRGPSIAPKAVGISIPSRYQIPMNGAAISVQYSA